MADDLRVPMKADFTCTHAVCALYLKTQKGYELGLKCLVENDEGEVVKATVTAMPCAECGSHMEQQKVPGRVVPITSDKL